MQIVALLLKGLLPIMKQLVVKLFPCRTFMFTEVVDSEPIILQHLLLRSPTSVCQPSFLYLNVLKLDMLEMICAYSQRCQLQL